MRTEIVGVGRQKKEREDKMTWYNNILGTAYAKAQRNNKEFGTIKEIKGM